MDILLWTLVFFNTLRDLVGFWRNFVVIRIDFFHRVNKVRFLRLKFFAVQKYFFLWFFIRFLWRGKNLFRWQFFLKTGNNINIWRLDWLILLGQNHRPIFWWIEKSINLDEDGLSVQRWWDSKFVHEHWVVNLLEHLSINIEIDPFLGMDTFKFRAEPFNNLVIRPSQGVFRRKHWVI
jgi:hypothetical protein